MLRAARAAHKRYMVCVAVFAVADVLGRLAPGGARAAHKWHMVCTVGVVADAGVALSLGVAKSRTSHTCYLVSFLN